MTRRIHEIAAQVQARLLAGGELRHMEPILRDAWASLYRWHGTGERVWRIADATDAPILPDDLPLATARIHAPGMAYQLPGRAEWIVVARHVASEPVIIHGETGFAYPEPMLTYCTELSDGALAAGTINLDGTPTWGDLYLPAGHSHGGKAARWLHQDEIAEEEKRFRLALSYFFKP